MVEQPQPSGPAGRRPRALFVGKLETAKGAHLLPGLARKLPSGVELVVAGEGKLTQRLVEENLGNVRLLGWADRQTLQELMNTSSVLVFPSLWPEPLSRVLLEACAAGLPTVAFPVGGNPEIIVDDVNGYLVSSVDEMALVASRIVSDGTLRGRLQEGAYHIARSKFSVDSVLPRVIQIYTSDIWVNSQ
jgi:glycosyltransferase involved in cell wall biosynthesis